MKYRQFSILMALLVLGLGCRKSSNDLDDPDGCNNPFTAIPCTTLEALGPYGSPSTSSGDEFTPVETQTRRQME